MKKILFLLFTLVQVFSYANMAEPVERGTLGSSPFIGQFVDVLHENLEVTIGPEFKQAWFQIEYHISSSKDGIQIPMLFYASEYLDDFEVTIDGKFIEIKRIPDDYGTHGNTRFNDFSYFFSDTGSFNVPNVYLSNTEGRGFGITMENMLYFEADLTKGEHVIKVNYRAQPWLDGHNWVNEYSFRYALSPVKYWKSFGVLDLIINGQDFDKTLKTNVAEPSNGNLETTAQWHFNELPADVLLISYIPEIDPLAQFFITLSPFGAALIVGLVFLFFHLKWMINYRKKNPQKKYSVILIMGSFIVPLIFVGTWMYSYGFIDHLIGSEASGRHGYSEFFVAVLFPLIVPFYALVFWIIDKRVKKNK